MVSVASGSTITIQCRVKHNIWDEGFLLNELPTTFSELVKLFSIKFYPNNFSISFIDTNFDLQPIDGSQTYRELISVIYKSDMKEIRLLVNTFIDTKPKNKKVMARKYSSRTSLFKDVIKELSENSSNISEDAYSSCSGCSASARKNTISTVDATATSLSSISDFKVKKDRKTKKPKDAIPITHSCIPCY
jgi:hypothetical protein